MKTGKAAVLVTPNQLKTWDTTVPDSVYGGVMLHVIVGGVDLAAVQSGAAVKALVDPSIV